MHPEQPRGDVVRVLNRNGAQQRTVDGVRRIVHCLAAEGLVEQGLLGRTPPQSSDDHLVRLIGGITAASPGMTLQQITAQLESIRERTPRGTPHLKT